MAQRARLRPPGPLLGALLTLGACLPGGAHLAAPAGPTTPGAGLPPSLRERSLADCLGGARLHCGDPGVRARTCAGLTPRATAACAAEAAACAAHLEVACGDEDRRRRAACEEGWQRWTNHQLFRVGPTGDLEVAPDAETDAVAARIHYVQVGLDAVAMRQLPGFYPHEQVLLGAEVQGLLPGGRVVRVVAEPKPSRGDDARLAWRRPFVLLPLLYTGQNLRVTIHLAPLSAAEYEQAAPRLRAAAARLGRLDLHDARALAEGDALFEAFLGPERTPRWSYSLTFYPAATVYRDQAQQLLLRGRTVVVLTPPGIPARATERALARGALGRRLTLRGATLVDRATDRPFVEAPYLILRVRRFLRSPRQGTPRQQLAARVDEALADRDGVAAQALLGPLAEALAADGALSPEERRLEGDFLALRRARTEAALAPAGSRARARHLRALLDVVRGLSADFAPLLTPAEAEHLRRLQAEARESLADVPAHAP